MGEVHSFAVRFYPYGFAHFSELPIRNLADKETPIGLLFGEKPARELGNRLSYVQLL